MLAHARTHTRKSLISSRTEETSDNVPGLLGPLAFLAALPSFPLPHSFIHSSITPTDAAYREREHSQWLTADAATAGQTGTGVCPWAEETAVPASPDAMEDSHGSWFEKTQRCVQDEPGKWEHRWVVGDSQDHSRIL